MSMLMARARTDNSCHINKMSNRTSIALYKTTKPQNEARFADYAILGDRLLFRHAEVARAFLGRPQS